MGVLVEAYLVWALDGNWNGYAHKTSLVRILGKQERRLLLVRDFKRTRKKIRPPKIYIMA